MLNINSTIENSIESPFQSPIKHPYNIPFNIKLLKKNDTHRNTVEQFIKQGYQHAFNANIYQFMPLLLTLYKGKKQAALGIRTCKKSSSFATSPLFVEQYIQAPIEQQGVLKSENIKRHHIVEIGNLHSNSKLLTLQLFLLTAVALYVSRYKYMVFAGTEQVLNIHQSIGIKLHHICMAKQSNLLEGADNWGSYYQTAPQVVAVNLQQVMEVITQSDKYQNLFEQLMVQIAELGIQLKAQGECL